MVMCAPVSRSRWLVANGDGDVCVRVQVAFSVFEQDEDGRVSVDELRKKLTSIGEKLSEEEVGGF
eukprot:2554241-Pleurochrysis_carterae.AAC.1